MRTLTLFAFTVLASSAAIAQNHTSQPQQRASAEERFCLTEKTSGAVVCGFATMAECLATSNAGRDGQCERNPQLPPSGTGTRQ